MEKQTKNVSADSSQFSSIFLYITIFFYDQYLKKYLLKGFKLTFWAITDLFGLTFDFFLMLSKYCTRKGHKYDLVYSVKCPQQTCKKKYNSETGKRLVERSDDRRRKYKNSHVYQHSVNSNHGLATFDDFTNPNSGYKHNKYKRKISEDLFIKSCRPNLRKEDTSFPLNLFNWDFNTFEVESFFVFTFDINFPKSIILVVEILL